MLKCCNSIILTSIIESINGLMYESLDCLRPMKYFCCCSRSMLFNKQNKYVLHIK